MPDLGQNDETPEDVFEEVVKQHAKAGACDFGSRFARNGCVTELGPEASKRAEEILRKRGLW